MTALPACGEAGRARSSRAERTSVREHGCGDERRASAHAGSAGRRLRLLALLPLAGCVIDIASEEELTSLRLVLQNPKETELGREGRPVTVNELLFDVQAIGPDGALVRKGYEPLAFLAAGGVRLPLRSACGGGMASGDAAWVLGRVPLAAGEARGVRLPVSGRAIFGQVALNLEEPRTRAIGATPPIYFPNATIPRLMEPWDPDARDATYCSPYLNRQVIIDGPPGKLVVSSVFKNGFGLSDASAAEYGSVFVFTFGQPRTTVQVGRVVDRVSGSIAKFNGFTQVANVNYDTSDKIDASLVPMPVEITAERRRIGSQAMNLDQHKWLQRHIAAPVRLTAKVCDAQGTRASSWQMYSTFVVTFDKVGDTMRDDCNTLRTFGVQLPGRGFANFDPDQSKDRTVTVTGMLQNSANPAGTALFWTLIVRDTADLVLQ